MNTASVWEVRAILRDADPAAWRPERAEELRRRVKSAASTLRASARTQPLADALEASLPEGATRARWSAFVGAVHPKYEALVADLPPESTPARPSVRPTNYARSLLHIASAGVALATVGFVPSHPVVLAIALAFATYAWSMEGLRRLSPRLNVVLMRFYGKVAHPHEHYRVNSATWYATALVFLALFATRPATMAALAVLGLADPVAALVGRRWGRHTLRAGRSLEGTLAFFATGTVVAALALRWAGGLSGAHLALLAVLAGFVGAIAELVTVKLDDNLTIPVMVGGVLAAAQLAIG